jgi:two-component system, NarL family, sensor histidine kinase EvgS
MKATGSDAVKRIGARDPGALRLGILIVSFVELAVSSVFAATTPDPGHFVVGAAPGAIPPLELNDSRQTIQGVSADFAQQIASALQRPLEWRTYPNRTAMIRALRRHEIDAATSATGADTEPGPPLLYSRPYVPTKQVYIERRTMGVRTGRIAYVEDQTSAQSVQAGYPALHPVGYTDTLSALLGVSLGDADAFVGDLVTAGYTIDHFDLIGLTISGFAPFDEAGYSFAFAPDSTLMQQRVDRILAALPLRFLLEVRARWAVTAEVTFSQPLVLTDAEREWIAAHPVIDYSMFANATPMTFRDASGQPAGLAVDMLAAIGSMTGLRFEGHLRDSIDQVTRDLRNGNASLIPYSLTASESTEERLSSVPFGDGVLVIVTRADAAPLRNAAALAGKRVAAWGNPPLLAMLKARAPTAKIVATTPIDGQFEAVLNNKADATVIDMTFANYAVGNPYRGKLAITGAFSEQPVPHGFLVASNEPMLLAILDRAIAHMHPGELDAIRRRWLLIEHPESLWERRRRQVEFGGALGGAVVLLLIGWAVSLRRQIARRIAAERAMRLAKEEAETANRAKSTFLATMSHEIRTPMNAVLGLLELELRSPGDRASTQRSLATAEQAARDLLGMIDDILDVAKIEAERLVLAPAPLELGGWAKGVAAIYEPAARSKGVTLIVRNIGANETGWVIADALRLRQVLGNLLSNAIKFTDAGAVTLAYSIGAVQGASRELLLAVSDTGIGIAPDQQALLFAPFTQARQDRPGRFGGTGLGLTICRRLMTMMGGAIDLSSVAGQGSCFSARVRLPVTEAQAPSLDVAGEAHRPVDGLALKGLRVLVVDDHPANRMLLQSQLASLGCEVETANDGHAAFARWTRGDAFDLILTDCSMPVMSGEDLARAIRTREAAGDAVKPARIVGVTANAQPEAVAEAIAAGMTQCLVKPLGLDALREALSLAASDALRELAAASFDAALLDGFGAQADALASALRTANREDLGDARKAMTSREFEQLSRIAHRMKGAAFVVGATPLADACLALQRACDASAEDVIHAAYEDFLREALALDAALSERGSGANWRPDAAQ